MLTLAFLIAVAAPSAKEPHWMDRMLAGYVLASKGDVGVYDGAKGFYLTRSIECDGADITLTLTRDRKVIYDQGFRVPGYPPVNGAMEAALDDGRHPLALKPLPSLSTGKGIKIGDSPGRVSSRLGRPSRIAHEGSRKQFLVYQYAWTSKDKDYASSYDESYTFKAGKLIEVAFSKSGA